MDEQPKRQRRWFQFGLRSVLVVVALLAIPLAWHVNGVQRQRAAVRRVLELGGRACYDNQLRRTKNGLGEEIPKPEPSRLASWLGIDHTQSLESVYLSGANLTEDDLRLVAGVPSVHGVDLAQTNVTCSMLQCLTSLPDLQRLNLHDTRVGDECLGQILHHKNLKLLQLSKTDFSDVGFGRLGALSNLVWMDLCYTQLSDESLEQFEKLSKLDWFVFAGTRVTPEGVERLRKALPSAKIIWP